MSPIACCLDRCLCDLLLRILCTTLITSATVAVLLTLHIRQVVLRRLLTAAICVVLSFASFRLGEHRRPLRLDVLPFPRKDEASTWLLPPWASAALGAYLLETFTARRPRRTVALLDGPATGVRFLLESPGTRSTEPSCSAVAQPNVVPKPAVALRRRAAFRVARFLDLSSGRPSRSWPSSSGAPVSAPVISGCTKWLTSAGGYQQTNPGYEACRERIRVLEQALETHRRELVASAVGLSTTVVVSFSEPSRRAENSAKASLYVPKRSSSRIETA